MRPGNKIITTGLAALYLAFFCASNAEAIRFIRTPRGIVSTPVFYGGGYAYWNPYYVDPNNYVNPGYYNSNLRNLDVTVPYNQLRMREAARQFNGGYY